MIPQIQFTLNVIAGMIASYTDLKTGYIYDWITFPLIGAGILLSIFTQQWMGLLLAGIIYAIGWLGYRSGKIGGGDIKFLMGIALVQPTYEGMLFVFSVLLIGALAACLMLSTYYVGKLLLTKPKIKWKTKRKGMAAALGGGVLVYMLYSAGNPLWPLETSLVLGISLLAGILFYAFEEEVKAHSFLQRITLNELEDDEVLAIEHLTHEEKQKMGKMATELIGTEDKLKLQHMGMHTLPVYRNLPKFAPFLFLGTLITYLFPQWIIPLVPAVF